MVRLPLRTKFLLLALALPAMGCGADVVPVQGKVTLNGQPLANASVMFLAQTPEGRDATGYTDANGVFRLSTFKPNDGALRGKYKVTVQAAPEVETPGPGGTPDEAQRAMPVGRIKPKAGAVIVPPKYSQPDQTPLLQEVPPQGEVLLELKGP